jgi:hypothetical protein
MRLVALALQVVHAAEAIARLDDPVSSTTGHAEAAPSDPVNVKFTVKPPLRVSRFDRYHPAPSSVP